MSVHKPNQVTKTQSSKKTVTTCGENGGQVDSLIKAQPTRLLRRQRHPTICDVPGCIEYLQNKGDLPRHRWNTHLLHGEWFFCGICGKEGRQLHNMVKHEVSVHYKGGLVCKEALDADHVCMQWFESPEALNDHRVTSHGHTPPGFVYVQPSRNGKKDRRVLEGPSDETLVRTAIEDLNKAGGPQVLENPPVAGASRHISGVGVTYFRLYLSREDLENKDVQRELLKHKWKAPQFVEFTRSLRKSRAAAPSPTNPPSAATPSLTNPPSAATPSPTNPPSAATPSPTNPPSAATPTYPHPLPGLSLLAEVTIELGRYETVSSRHEDVMDVDPPSLYSMSSDTTRDLDFGRYEAVRSGDDDAMDVDSSPRHSSDAIRNPPAPPSSSSSSTSNLPELYWSSASTSPASSIRTLDVSPCNPVRGIYRTRCLQSLYPSETPLTPISQESITGRFARPTLSQSPFGLHTPARWPSPHPTLSDSQKDTHRDAPTISTGTQSYWDVVLLRQVEQQKHPDVAPRPRHHSPSLS